MLVSFPLVIDFIFYSAYFYIRISSNCFKSVSTFLLILATFSLILRSASPVARLSNKASLIYDKKYFKLKLPDTNIFFILLEDIGVNDSFFATIVDFLFQLFVL